MPPLASLTPSLILTVVFGPPPTRRQQRCGAARAGSYQTEEHHAQRSSELSEGLLSKALRDVRSGRLQENRAALLYGIPPPGILRSQLEAPGPIQREDVTSRDVTSSARGEEVRLVLQRVAAWAELGGERRDVLPSLLCPAEGFVSVFTSPGSERISTSVSPRSNRAPDQLFLSLNLVAWLRPLHYHHNTTTTTNIAATSSSPLRLHRALLPSLDLPDLSHRCPAHHRCSSLDDPEERGGA